MEKIKLLLYCCKDKRGYLHFDTRPEITRKYYLSPDSSPFGTYEPNNYLNGKILVECDFEIEEIKHYIHEEPDVDVGVAILPGFECDAYCTKTLGHFQLLEKACMECYSLPNITVNDELNDYLQGKNGKAIYIKNLHIFDKPRELNEYWKKGERVKIAPKNMMLVQNIYEDKIVISLKEVKEIKVEEYIVISVSPEEMCRLLNGDQTVLVRKKVLKEMIK